MKHFFRLALAPLTVLCAGAADPSVEGSLIVDLPPLEVTGRYLQRPIQKIPAAITLITREEIQEGTEQLSLAEALTGTPGVFVSNPYNFAQDSRIAIRGFGARSDFGVRGIKLLVDGIPSTTPDGQGELDGLDLGSAERIEVMRGPSSALYGASSGGVILIDSETGRRPTALESRWTVGDHGLLNAQLKLRTRGDDAATLLNLNTLRYDGFRAHSETEQHKANAKILLDLSPAQQLTLIVNLIEMPTQNDPGGLTEAQAREDPKQASARNRLFAAGESVTQGRLGLVYSAAISNGQSLTLSAYGIERDFENRLPFASGGQVSLARSVAGGAVLYRHELDRWSYAGGINYDFQDDDRRNFDNLDGQRGNLALDQNERVQSLGAFVVGTFQLHPAFSLSGALRYDSIEFDVRDAFDSDGDDSGAVRFREISPMIGMTWAPTERVVIYTHFATSFETPTTTELDNPGGGGFNPGLVPQRAVSAEIGIKSRVEFLSKPTSLDLSLFHIAIDDALVGYELASAPGRSFFRNAGSEERVGFEASLKVDLTAELSSYLAYTGSDFSSETRSSDPREASGHQIPGIPRQFADFGLHYETPNGWFVRANTRVVGDFYANDANTAKVRGYAVTDLRAGAQFTYRKWQLSPFLGVKNLLDQAYPSNVRINAFGGRYFEPAPGRNLYAGFTLRYLFD